MNAFAFDIEWMNPDVPMFRLSVQSNDGLDQWRQWVESHLVRPGFDSRRRAKVFHRNLDCRRLRTILERAGAIVKWDHATMAWWNLGFKSPWLHPDVVGIEGRE
jgi:hypothetical protein